MGKSNSRSMWAAGILIGLGIGLLLLVVFGMLDQFRINWVTVSGGSEGPAVPTVNEPAPDFELETLSGGSTRLSDYRGQVVMINFWATWCGPCRDEMPLIQEYYERYDGEMVVLGVNVGERRADVEKFVKEVEVDFPILLDENIEVERLYRVRAYPTTFFVDTEGTILYQHIGYLQERQLVQYLAQAGLND